MDEFETEKAHIVKIQVVAALLTLVVSRAILREFVDHAEEQDEECVFPTERWASDRKVAAWRSVGNTHSSPCSSA